MKNQTCPILKYNILPLKNISTPNSSTNYSKFYSKNGNPYAMDESGTEYNLASAGMSSFNISDGASGSTITNSSTVEISSSNSSISVILSGTSFDLTTTASGAFDIESAQDAIGTILLNDTTIDFIYNDVAPSITAVVLGMQVSGAVKLTAGAVADQEYLKRSGTSIIGSSIPASSPTLSSTYVAFGSGTNVLTGSAHLTWDNIKLNISGSLCFDELAALTTYTADKGTICALASDRRPYYLDGANTVVEILPIYKQCFNVAMDGKATYSLLPYVEETGQTAMAPGGATYTETITFDSSKGLTSAYGNWFWTVHTAPFYQQSKISIGVPFRWYTKDASIGSGSKCNKCRVGARLYVSNASHFESVKIKLTNGTNSGSKTITPTTTITDYWMDLTDISGWSNTTNLYSTVVFNGISGLADNTLVECHLEYIQVELWGN